jgi:predicted MFS family arabinose efflux permease
VKQLSALFKNAYGGLSPEVWWLALATLINRSGTMVILFLSLYVTDHLHLTVQNAGVVMAVFGAGSLCGVFLSGRFTDKLGYYPVILFSLFGGGIMFLLLSILKSYPVICFATFFMSCIAEAFRPPMMAAISFYSTPENYTRSISLVRLAINLGFSIGPVFGGMLAMIDYRFIFWADGVTCFGAGLIILFFIKNKYAESKKEKNVAAEPVRSAYRDRIYLYFMFICMLYAMSFFQFFSTMPLYYKNVFHLKENEIGALVAINAILVASVEMILVYKIQHRWSKYKFIAIGALLLIVSYLSLPFFPSVALFVIINIVISFSEMLAMPFMNTIMNERSNDRNKGQYAALYAMAWSVAQILLPVIATQTIARFGYNMLWYEMTFVAAVVMAGALVIEKMVAKEKAAGELKAV